MDENKLNKEDKNFVKRIIKEIDDFLSAMTKEERKEFFKQYEIEVIEDDSTEEKQQLINLLTVLKAVLNLKIQSNSTQEKPLKQDVKKNQKEKTPTFEEIQKMMAFMTNKYQPPFTLKGTRHIPTKNEIEAMQKAKERINEGNLRELEAKAVAEKEGIVYGNKAKETSSANKRHHQLIRLKAYLTVLYVLNEKSVVEDEKLFAELRKQSDSQHKKTGMDEFVKELELEKSLLPCKKPIPPMTPLEYIKLNNEIIDACRRNDEAYSLGLELLAMPTPGPDQQYKK